MKVHKWVYYANPRNQRIKLQACQQCGELKTSHGSEQDCSKSSNLFSRLGWQVWNERLVESRSAA